MMFIALCGSEYVEAEYDLARLLRRVAELCDPRRPEDAAVWLGLRLVVVIHHDGRLTWLMPELKPAEEAASAA